MNDDERKRLLRAAQQQQNINLWLGLGGLVGAVAGFLLGVFWLGPLIDNAFWEVASVLGATAVGWWIARYLTLAFLAR